MSVPTQRLVEYLTTRHITVYRLVMEHSSLSKAAKILSVSPSAVSYALTDLESVCGFELFIRKPGMRDIFPTTAGLRMKPYFDAVFDALMKLAGEIKLAKINPDYRPSR